MTNPPPPPLPETKRVAIDWRIKVLIGLAVVLFLLRVFGLIRVFSVPTGAMIPTISPGDHVMMEGVTYLVRKPRRGDLAIFETGGIEAITTATLYVKRIVGEPGDSVRIVDGELYINDEHVVLSNAVGKIEYHLPDGLAKTPPLVNVIVPNGSFYVLGDNSPNSFDSRFWGFVPADAIIGRVAICYWPPQRIGRVR